MLAERYQFVHQLLTNVRDKLDRLAEALLREESIDQEELAQILGPRPQAGEANIVMAPRPNRNETVPEKLEALS